MPVKKGSTIRYPKDRKRPMKHIVHTHTRRGKRVESFTRGSGIKNQSQRSSRVVGKPFDEDTKMGELGFTVDFTYGPDDGESVVVIADSYQAALEEAFDERVDTRMPIEVNVIDPDLNTILKFVGESAKKAGAYGLKTITKTGKVGAKYAVRGVKAGTRLGVKGAKAVARGVKVGLTESSKMALYEIERSKVRRLIKQAYSKDPIERKTARIAIKRVYPDVYDICSFSTDRRSLRRKAPEVIRLPKKYVSRAVTEKGDVVGCEMCNYRGYSIIDGQVIPCEYCRPKQFKSQVVKRR